MSYAPESRTATAPAPAPGAESKFDHLRALLREMFQLDRGDLDFGLYRIMKLKSAEISSFLDHDLLPQVKTKLRLTSDEDRALLHEQLGSAYKSAWALGLRPDENPPPAIVEMNHRLAEMQKDADAEADVYNHLATFFGRYYAEGDFVSQRRYSSGGRSAYLIPYDGEEVKLHWANADQYYVKTTENYASYVFVVGEGAASRRVRFEIAAANNEQDNIKEAATRQRRFVLASGRGAVTVEGGDLVVRFEHRPLTANEKKRWPGNGRTQQARINQAAVERIDRALDPEWQILLAAPAPTEADPDRTALSRHVERYAAKNSFDYFIHKDLGGFLHRELDLYLNTDVLNLDDLEQGDAARLDRALARVRAARHVGGKIIDFLAQLEDFQKRLWLKKKFVLETNWCVTLDRVPRSLYPEIAANEAQCAEWVDLFAVDEIVGDLTNGGVAWSDPPSVAFLEANPFLVVDTKHFDRAFADRLLAALSDAGPLHEQMDGLLVHGENFQALNLLQARYLGRVQCVYIDPPYNTESSAILYKNDYKDSSWLALMHDRLSLGKELLADDGILCCAIDDEEAWRLRALLQTVFERELGVVPVRTTPAGRKSKARFSPTHEYAVFHGRPAAVPGSLLKRERELARYPFSDELGRYAWNNLIRHGSNDRREDRPKLYYPIYVAADDSLRVPKMEWNEQEREWQALEEPRSDEVAVWPTRTHEGEVVEKNWHHQIWNRLESSSGEYRIRRNGDGEEGISIDFKIRMDESAMPRTWWDAAEYASANHGTRVLKELFADKPFDFPKSVALVEDCIRASGGDRSDACIVDFFAGSGTAGHAVLNLNRADRGRRAYVLAEVGRHFDDVLVPRVKKVVHSPDWKNGKPVSRAGLSQLFQCVRLESYEDAMDGLDVAAPKSGQDDLLGDDPALAEDYTLRYALGVETAGSVTLLGQELTGPHSCRVAVVRDGVRREEGVDLPETFNCLLGLRVISRRMIDGVIAIAGVDAGGRNCLIFWRNVERMDADALDAWFTAHRDEFGEPLDVIYVNGDHTLNALRRPGETWVAETIEPEFRRLMFEGER